MPAPGSSTAVRGSESEPPARASESTQAGTVRGRVLLVAPLSCQCKLPAAATGTGPGTGALGAAAPLAGSQLSHSRPLSAMGLVMSGASAGFDRASSRLPLAVRTVTGGRLTIPKGVAASGLVTLVGLDSEGTFEPPPLL